MGFARIWGLCLVSVSIVVCLVNSQDYPNIDPDDLPRTRFTCKNKVPGGYYADIETGCQMYHVCYKSNDGLMQDTKFLCGNGTVFDQRHLVCQDYEKVRNCEDSRRFYRNVPKGLKEPRIVRMRNTERIREVTYLKDFPRYSADDLPQTRFTCKNKVQGGYYADIETDCQMYHVCQRNKIGRLESTKFLCGNSTVFDQRHLVCQDYMRVPNCRDSRKYYRNGATILEELEARMMRSGSSCHGFKLDAIRTYGYDVQLRIRLLSTNLPQPPTNHCDTYQWHPQEKSSPQSPNSQQ
ncbi:hypothetical protein JTE90_027323 [Oedothorax gibbosus]|uniref:Chitin-binding type-2 domain-containing protein n=1 Tax=Oedothorax gibbosus TaxID=931172 RepID=A0AAV6W348_9ARAC|nr:hypothetical protein JTE90_027323 [Oedothorax gibbosus]